MAYHEIIGVLEVLDEEYPSQGLIVPGFFTNYETWDKVIKAQCDMIVVLKPNDEFIFSLLQELVNKTITIYIDSQNAKRPLDELFNEINDWISNNNVKGFFIDNVNGDEYEYYQQISSLLSNSGKKIIMSSKSPLDDKFFNIADIVVFANSASVFNSGLCSDVNADKRGVIVYDADSFQKPSCKYFYFTDLPDQYSGLSRFFDEMVDSVKYY